METRAVSMASLVHSDKQTVDAIKDELRSIEEIVCSPKPSKPQLSPSSKQRWRATVRQIIFMEKAKEKVLQSYGAESIQRLKNTTSLSLLCSLPQLNQLEPFELMALNQQVEYKEYRSNAIVCSGTLASDRVFIVRTGVLSVRIANSAERLQYVSGDMLDAYEMLTKEPTMTVLAHSTTECYHFPRSALYEYEKKLPTTPLSTNLFSVRYNDPESESFRKWAKETANCLQYDATDNSSRTTPQAFLRDILLTVSPELDLDHCIHCMAQCFIRLFQATTVRFYLVNTSNTQFHTKFSNDEFQDLHTPTNFGIPGVVYTTSKSFLATSTQLDSLTFDPLMYTQCGSVMACPVVVSSSQSIGGVWEVINSPDKAAYSRHEIQLLELAAQFTQPYLLQCGTVTRHLGSVSEVSNDLTIKPRIVRLCTKVKKITICAALYHGDTLLVPVVTSPVLHGTSISSTIREFECLEGLVFGCNVQSLPRGAHISISICDKNNQCLAQTKYFVFSFDHYFRLGTLYLALYPSLSLPVEYHECLLDEGHTHEEYAMIEMPTSPVLLTYRSSNMTWAAPQSTNTPQPVFTAKQTSLIAAFERNPLKTLTNEDRVFFWSYRANLFTTSAALMPFLLSVNWANRAHVTEAYKYLYLWSPPTALQALQLLSPKFADPFVRAYAVRCLDSLPDYRLRLYLLQLVQALKCEQHHDSALMRFLFVRGLKSPSEVGYSLFWLLQAELHVPFVHDRFELLSTQYLCHSGVFRVELYQSIYVMKLLESIASEIKVTTCARDSILRSKLESALLPDCFQLPLHPNVFYSGFNIEKCRVMDSAKKPLFLHLEPLKHQSLSATIFKSGDDLRQDQLTLQILRVMDDLWKSEGLDLKVSAYACASTGDNIGFIQVVDQAATLAKICSDRHKHKKMQKLAAAKTALFGKQVFAQWLHNDDTHLRDEIILNFVASCAGYSVATFVLGIGDRHNDNLMLSENGQFLHIDFGHFLGHFKTFMGYQRETAPFVLTPAMVHVMGDKFDQFQTLCTQAFQILRANSSFLITLLELASSAGIPELRLDTITWLQDALMLDLTDAQAQQRLEALIQDAMKNVTTRINHATHIMAH